MLMWWLVLLLLPTLKSVFCSLVTSLYLPNTEDLSLWLWPKPDLHSGMRTEVSTHTVPSKLGTASPCWRLAGAVPSPALSRLEALTRAVQVAEPLGSCGFQGGPCPGRRRD
uniref:Secreted protein n=1 Tax=Pongo abelii TaxID=9601 RepID=H2N8R1_PONAB